MQLLSLTPERPVADGTEFDIPRSYGGIYGLVIPGMDTEKGPYGQKRKIKKKKIILLISLLRG